MTVYTPAWLTAVQNTLSIPLTWIKPLLSIQWGWGDTAASPILTNLRVKLLSDTPSLYMNGIVFFGIQFPFFVNLMVRWGGQAASPAYLQTHIGWRPVDGAPVIVFRLQSDDSAQGGLVGGWVDGPK